MFVIIKWFLSDSKPQPFCGWKAAILNTYSVNSIINICRSTINSKAGNSRDRLFPSLENIHICWRVALFAVYLLISMDTISYALHQMILSATSIGVSCYLAYILHFVLQVSFAVIHEHYTALKPQFQWLFNICQDFCVVCVSTYAVNLLLFFTRCVHGICQCLNHHVLIS